MIKHVSTQVVTCTVKTRCDISQFTMRGVSRRDSDPQKGERWEKKGQIDNIKFTRLIMP